MIEQHENQLTVSFPTPEAARAFTQFLTALFSPVAPLSTTVPPALETSDPLSDQSPPIPASPEPVRSQHVVLTEERQDQLYQQRQQGQTQHQRLLRAQTTLRDGTLPFRAMHEPPQPSGQPSPRQKAQQEGGFADGVGVLPEAERKRSKLRPAVSKDSPLR